MKPKPPCNVVGGVGLFADCLRNSPLELVRALWEICLRGQRLCFFAKGMPAPVNVDKSGMYGQFAARNIP